MARGARNFYLLIFIAIFVIISVSLYSSLDGPSVAVQRSQQNVQSESQVVQLRAQMASLEEKLRKNGEEMDELRKELTESERIRKAVMNKQIEKENEIYDEKAEARKGVRKNAEGPKVPDDGGENEKNEQKAQVAQPDRGGNKAEVVHRFLSKTTVSPLNEGICKLRANYSVPHSKIQMFDMYDLISFDNPDGGVWKQGWDIKYDEEKVKEEPQLEVILIPHSHCDPGWIRTFEDYFEAQTKSILDSMVEQLPRQEEMTFIYAEVSFLELWWRQASEGKRNTVKDLISTGRLEVVTGGWVMTDEANAHYHATVVELIEGHEWIKNNLGPAAIPRTHWSIDPFGLSPTLPLLISASNITRAAVQRVHYSVKKELARQRNLEFVWRQMWDEKGETGVRTHMFPFYSYDVPHTCGPDPKICCQFDFRRLPAGGGMGCPWGISPQLIHENNIESRAHMLYDQYRKKAQLYKSNALLVPLGDDFRYDGEFEWKVQYDNYKKLFNYMNEKKEWNVKAKFGTLSDYFNVLERHLKDQNMELEVLSGDFFTYADRDDHYWSGYFTSRPFYKQLDRVLQHYLRSAEISFSLARLSASFSSSVDDTYNRLVTARRALSLFQHHDGVTGTAKDHVVKDYGEKMLSALMDCEEVMAVSFAALLQKKGAAAGQLQLDETRRRHDTLPERRIAEVGGSIILFNSLSFTRKEVVCVRVADVKARVSLSGGDRPRQQLNPTVKWDNEKTQLTVSHDEFELCWETSVGPLSLQTFKIESGEGKETEKGTLKGTVNVDSPDFPISSIGSSVEMKNELITVKFDTTTGMLKSVIPSGGTEVNTRMYFNSYGARGPKKMDNGGTDNPSGAYLFLPDGKGKPIHVTGPSFLAVAGPLTNRLYVVGPNEFKMTTTYILNDGAPYLEISNEIDVSLNSGNIEVAMKLETSIESGDAIYTDLNGMQLIRRRRQLDKLPLQAHFYPMPSSAFIESSTTRVSLLGAQALGVASLKSGELEVMLERRLLQDDSRGLQQGVMDNKRTASHFRLMVEPLKGETKSDAERTGFLSLPSHVASVSLHYPWVKMLSEDPEIASSFTGLHSSLPCDTHIVTMRTSSLVSTYGQSGPSSSSPSNSSALILFRPLIDCRSVVPSPIGCSSSSQLVPSVLFGDKLKSTSSASLTLLYESNENVSRLDVNPQQIKTYKLNY